ncbi:hypothetical protein VTN96DRAFT_6227 [Rasamsonia emersonii]
MANNTISSSTNVNSSLYPTRKEVASGMAMGDPPSTTSTTSQMSSGSVDHAVLSPENSDQERNLQTDEPFSPVWNTTHNQYPPGTPSEEDFIHAGSWINQVPQPANTSHRRSRRHRPQTQLRAYLRQEPHKEPWNAFVAQNRN